MGSLSGQDLEDGADGIPGNETAELQAMGAPNDNLQLTCTATTCYYLLLTTYRLMLVTTTCYYLLLTTYRLLLLTTTCHYLLLTTYHL
jgi:hypothetical protein